MNRTSPYLQDSEAVSPDALEHEIRQTRNRMDETLDQISDKIDPRPYVDEAVDWVKSKTENIDSEAIKHSVAEAGQKTGQVVKENPLPLILGGLAIASAFLPSDLFRRKSKSAEAATPRPQPRPETSTLPQPTGPQPLGTPMARQLPGGKVMAQQLHHQQHHNGNSQHNGNGNGSSLKQKAQGLASEATDQWNAATESVSDSAHQAKQKVTGATEKAQQSIQHASHQAADSIRHAAQSTASTASELSRKTRDRFDSGRREHPLALCAGALAAGVVTALLLPRTRKEDEMCGEEAAQFRQELKSKGETMLDQGKQTLAENDLDVEGLKHRAEDAIDQAGDSAKEAIDETLENQG